MGYHDGLFKKGLDYKFNGGKNAGKTVEEVARSSPDTILFLAFNPKGPHWQFKSEVLKLVNEVKYPTKKPEK